MHPSDCGCRVARLLAAAPPPTVLALARSGNTLGGRVAGFSSLLTVCVLLFECPFEWLGVFFLYAPALLSCYRFTSFAPRPLRRTGATIKKEFVCPVCTRPVVARIVVGAVVA